jgi:hypothetical protein
VAAIAAGARAACVGQWRRRLLLPLAGCSVLPLAPGAGKVPAAASAHHAATPGLLVAWAPPCCTALSRGALLAM